MITNTGLCQSLSAEEIIILMKKLGATDYQDNGSSISFRTICHNLEESEGGFNLTYYKDSKLFYCFSQCSHTYDIITLTRARISLITDKDYHYSDAFFWVLNNAGKDLIGNELPQVESHVSIAEKYRKGDLLVEFPEYNSNVLDCFIQFPIPEWISDGISFKTMKEYNIRYSISRNAVILPHYDVKSRLIGIRERRLTEDKHFLKRYGKYRPVRVENITYKHPTGLNLYGLNKTKNNIKKIGIAIVAESEKAVLQTETFLGKDTNTVVGVCGNNFNRWQLRLLVDYCKPKEIVFAFDKQKGNPSSQFQRLWELGKKYSSYADFSFMFDYKNLLKDKESPFDRGKETFMELLRSRVVIK